MTWLWSLEEGELEIVLAGIGGRVGAGFSGLQRRVLASGIGKMRI